MASTNVAAVVGVGPGTGSAVARKLAGEGLAVGLMARNQSKLAPEQAAIEAAGGRALSVTADASDPESLGAALDQIAAKLGPIDVLVYNASGFELGGVLDLSAEAFEQCWKTTCLGAFVAAQRVVPAMVERGAGTLLFTGATAALRGSAGWSALAVGKFGLRALAQSLARELGPKGIHVAHVIVDGMIDTPRVRGMMPNKDPAEMLSPNAIAEAYWQLHRQHPSAWTQELDLRPSVEKF